MEIDCEVFFTVILLLPLIQERLFSVADESMCTGLPLSLRVLSLFREKVVRLTDCLDMTIAVGWDV